MVKTIVVIVSVLWGFSGIHALYKLAFYLLVNCVNFGILGNWDTVRHRMAQMPQRLIVPISTSALTALRRRALPDGVV